MIAGSEYTGIFNTKNGARTPVDADSLPFVAILVDGVLTSVVATVESGAVAGEYTYTFTVPANWLPENEVHARIEATIEGWPRRDTRKLEAVEDDSSDKVDDLWRIAGLDPSNPVVTTTTSTAADYDYSPSVIYTGDTASVETVYMAGANADGSAIDVTESGWTCSSQVMNSKHESVGSILPITDMAEVGGVQHFAARLTIAESDLMVNDLAYIKPVNYFWLVSIENTALDYRDTHEVKLSVHKRP